MITSDKMGGVVLSGEDATAFARQIRNGRASQAAKDLLTLGDSLLQRFAQRASDSPVKKKATTHARAILSPSAD